MSATSIGLLRVRGAGEDTPALRLGLTSLLATGDLAPPDLPPAAILVVRRLADPLPRRLPARRRGVRLDPRWEEAARHVVTAHYKRAYRPVRGDVPPDADAVVFADEAELLACLALDLARGLARRWWWRHLRLRDAHSPAALLEQVFAQYVVHVPAAFDLLCGTGAIDEVIASLTADAARRTLVRIATACECPAVLHATPAVPAPTQDSAGAALHDAGRALPVEAGPASAPERADARRPATDAAPAAPVPPWEPIAGRVAGANLDPEQAALAGIAVCLHRRPSVVRSPAFAAALAHWRRTVQTMAAPRPPAGAAAGDHGPVPQRLSPPTGIAAAALVPPPQGDVQFDSADGARRTVSPAPRSSGAPVVSERAAPPAPEGSDEPAAPLWIADEAVQTDIAGVFHLIDAMLRLELPDCFEHDWRLATCAGAWGTLEALAGGLLRADFDQFAHDPVWTLLAALADRPPGAPIGAGCVTPPVFSLPFLWRSQIPDDTSLARVLRPARLLPAAARRLAPACARWLARALPFVEWRLAGALGLKPGDQSQVGRVLLRHPGRVHHTASHVDIVMALDVVSLPVRLAGLDRDPGWVPAYGRVVSFHFD